MLPYYIYEDYRNCKGRWEVINGIPFSMMPGQAPQHQLVAGNISSQLVDALKKACYCSVYLPIDYVINEATIVQPDVLVACKDITKVYLDFAPAFVTDVSSSSTALKDRHIKYALYEQQQFPIT